MARAFVIALVVFLIGNVSRADNIYFRNGAVLKNCVVRDTVDNTITVLTTTGTRTFPLTSIDRIEPQPLDSSMPSSVVTGLEASGVDDDLQPVKPDLRPQRLYLLPVSAIAFTLAYTNWDTYGRTSGDTKTKCAVYGSIYLAAGILNTVLALERVDLQLSPVSVGFSYHL